MFEIVQNMTVPPENGHAYMLRSQRKLWLHQRKKRVKRKLQHQRQHLLRMEKAVAQGAQGTLKYLERLPMELLLTSAILRMPLLLLALRAEQVPPVLGRGRNGSEVQRMRVKTRLQDRGADEAGPEMLLLLKINVAYTYMYCSRLAVLRLFSNG